MPHLVIVLALITLLAGCQSAGEPTGRRSLEMTVDGHWIGAGVSYGEYRDGQSPDGAAPSVEELRADLHLLAEHFSMIRMYGTRSAERVCRIIREDDLPLRFMVGAWIGTESSPDDVAANESEVANAIRLANDYPDVVMAINIGNETQVFWTGHPVNRETLIGYLREARVGTTVPVTTCDDYNFWNKPESEAVAAECDFIGLHAYAMWNSQTLVNALSWTREQIADIAQRHPDHEIVHCETGWATTVHTEGEQARLIVGAAGEREQELFYRAYRAWATEAGLAHFYFSAFDENWKGGGHPDEVEKHWGLFNADRTPKLAIE